MKWWLFWKKEQEPEVPVLFLQAINKTYPKVLTRTVGDSQYAGVSDKVMFGAIFLFRKAVGVFDVPQWSKQFQCEDYSRLFRLALSAAYKKKGGTLESPACASIVYAPEGGMGGFALHEIVVIMTDKNEMIEIEPQTYLRTREGGEMRLSDKERQSVIEVRV